MEFGGGLGYGKIPGVKLGLRERILQVIDCIELMQCNRKSANLYK